jgi:hypothetical protein
MATSELMERVWSRVTDKVSTGMKASQRTFLWEQICWRVLLQVLRYVYLRWIGLKWLIDADDG